MSRVESAQQCIHTHNTKTEAAVVVIYASVTAENTVPLR